MKRIASRNEQAPPPEAIGDLSRFLAVAEFEPEARQCLPRPVYEYVAGGAGDEHSLRANEESYRRIFLRPRVLRPVVPVDLGQKLFGSPLPVPLVLVEAARRGADLDEDKARYVRVIEYQVPDREGDGTGELIALITTITDPRRAPAGALAQAYHQRWEHETGNRQLKTYLRGPGRVLRSRSPDMVRQEIYGYLLAHYAISALICKAATEADVDPDRVKFKRTVRLVRRRVADPAFPP